MTPPPPLPPFFPLSADEIEAKDRAIYQHEERGISLQKEEIFPAPDKRSPFGEESSDSFHYSHLENEFSSFPTPRVLPPPPPPRQRSKVSPVPLLSPSFFSPARTSPPMSEIGRNPKAFFSRCLFGAV